MAPESDHLAGAAHRVTDDALRKTPEPPRLSHVVAVVLELAIVATLAAHHSVVGLVLCVCYLWFSATLAFFQ